MVAHVLEGLKFAVVFGHLHHDHRVRVGFGGFEVVRRVEQVVAHRLDRVDEHVADLVVGVRDAVVLGGVVLVVVHPVPALKVLEVAADDGQHTLLVGRRVDGEGDDLLLAVGLDGLEPAVGPAPLDDLLLDLHELLVVGEGKVLARGELFGDLAFEAEADDELAVDGAPVVLGCLDVVDVAGLGLVDALLLGRRCEARGGGGGRAGRHWNLLELRDVTRFYMGTSRQTCFAVLARCWLMTISC